MTLMWATLLAWIVPRSQEITGWSAMGLHCPWLEFAAMYVTPAGSCSLTVTFRTRLFEGLYSVMRKSIFVPIGIALAGLGKTAVEMANRLFPCAEANFLGPTTPAPTKTANRVASVAATTTT